MADLVSIDRDRLAELLWFAQLGDIANSQRRLRNGFRHVPVCSHPEDREPGCFSCRTFAAAEAALGG